MQSDWEKFVKTGSIIDYLKYRGLSSGVSENSEGNNNADYNRGNSNS